MNVTRLRLANFKRFTDLTIDLSCAGAPKLVLLIRNSSGARLRLNMVKFKS